MASMAVAPARVCGTSSSPARSRQIKRVDIAVPYFYPGRSFRRAEWQAMLADALPESADDCRIFRSFPYRLCVEHIR